MKGQVKRVKGMKGVVVMEVKERGEKKVGRRNREKTRMVGSIGENT